MRALISYGVAGLILIAGAIWLGSGVFVTGGKGPGNGERPIVAVVSNDKPVSADPVLSAEVDAKSKAAEEAKKAADAAKAEADTAATALNAADTEAKKRELAEELEAKRLAAEKAKTAADAAKKAADDAAAAHKTAEEEATKLKTELDAVNTISQRVAEAGSETGKEQSVRTETFAVQAFPIDVPLRGRTKAKSMTTITPETTGIVSAINVTKGQAVKPGDVICTLDEGTRAAAVAQAEAALAQAQVDFDTNKQLRGKGLATANSANALESALKAAQAGFDQAKAEFDRTQVKTEVAGIVQDPLAMVGSMLSPGQPCATVVELDPMLFVASVPEARIGLAKLGLKAKIDTVTGQSVEGEVSYIASLADEATRSFPIEIQIPNKDGKVLSGVTATATVTMGTVPAHLLPQSVLTLDDQGALGVRTVKDGVVEFYPITIVSDSRQGVWVTGLPPTADVITMGQEYVISGQKVNATNVTGTAVSKEAEAAAEGVKS
ncbi:MAG: efflux transporter periplasmic adaptor subunit [Devosia sp.]|uniref:efflux RND transporter periplasmic adaptor subunit n=1 Tax=Devosia sp. TaxID=1871048 RepID=UPI002631597E|nr:efflux RND transporter periplasmic adaptor subunit [Devosia sp.]MDB5538968.1 efflux transporter periplasmic adaptor subunit [Devosia sp.]